MESLHEAPKKFGAQLHETFAKLAQKPQISFGMAQKPFINVNYSVDCEKSFKIFRTQGLKT